MTGSLRGAEEACVCVARDANGRFCSGNCSEVSFLASLKTCLERRSPFAATGARRVLQEAATSRRQDASPIIGGRDVAAKPCRDGHYLFQVTHRLGPDVPCRRAVGY